MGMALLQRSMGTRILRQAAEKSQVFTGRLAPPGELQ
jgi:hypothetical protein